MNVLNDKDRILTIILEVVKEIGEDSENDQLMNATSDTLLYGNEGSLDSMSLVYLVSNMEKRVKEEFGKNIVIVNKRAMSVKNSPFKDVKTLADFIELLLK